MAVVSLVKLTSNNFDDNDSNARIKVSWRTSFNQKEILSHTVFLYEVVLQNVDGVGDLDVRRRRIATGSYLATQEPIDREVSKEVDRAFLDEDFQFLGIGDTTDEWRAEIHLRPFAPEKASAVSEELLREEFGTS